MPGDPKAKQRPAPGVHGPAAVARDRTSAVVGAGIVALFVIGVVTVFGEPLSALLSPDPTAASAEQAAPASPTSFGRSDGGGNS